MISLNVVTFALGLNIFFKYEKIEHERKHRITGVVIDNEELFKCHLGFISLSYLFQDN